VIPRSFGLLPLFLPLFTAPSGAAQEVSTTALTRPDVELPEPFSRVASLRELPDRRVLVVDSRDRILWIGDFSRGAATQLGRQGSGPGEYRAPTDVFPMPGDSAAVFDGDGSRLVMISPDGRLSEVVSLAHLAAISPGALQVRSRFIPRVADSRGRLFSVGTSIRPTSTGLELVDSVPVVRWTRGANETEPVAFLRTRSLRERGGDVDATWAAMNSLIPFIVGDQYAVAADGRVAVLRYDDYRVDFILPSGQIVRGQPNRFTPVRVTEAHKREWRDSVAASGPSAAVQRPEPPRWPVALPPFLSRPALFAPDGTLWVRRAGDVGAPTLYDLVDPRGTVVRQVTFPTRSRVVGFGRSAVYVVRVDEDDLQYLQRFRLP
jgi:hypothetical protein